LGNEININVVLGGSSVGADGGHLPLQTEDYIIIDLQAINYDLLKKNSQ
jgi:hypothetical protein